MWPNYQTIEAGISRNNKYKWWHNDRQYVVWLDFRGQFFGEIDRQGITSAWSVRDIVDKLFRLTNKKGWYNMPT